MNKQTLIEDNMKLVYSIISREYPTYLYDEDIVQSGMLGLCKAANTWDETKSKFSTYAWKCIRNEINQEFVKRKPHSKNISLDAQIADDGTLKDILVGDTDVYYSDNSTFYSQLSCEEQEILTLDSMGYSTTEIAELSGYSTQKIRKMLRIIKFKWRNYDGS